MVEFFLKKGADVNWKVVGNTWAEYKHVPMMMALTTEKEGMEEIVNLLFRSGFKGEER